MINICVDMLMLRGTSLAHPVPSERWTEVGKAQYWAVDLVIVGNGEPLYTVPSANQTVVKVV
jgi:hypothetical protein